MLCCTLYDADKYGVGEFLTTPISEIQQNKKQQEICSQCTDKGLHAYYTYEAPAVQTKSLKNVLADTMQYLVDTPVAGATAQLKIDVRISQ